MFDPYHKWLGISDGQRPPDHYRLLGLEPFESDKEVIQAAADRQMGHVRQYQSGDRAELSQKVLNEIANAKVCLLQADRKGAYDAQLRKKLARSAPPPVSGSREDRAAPTLPVIRTVESKAVTRVKSRSALPAMVVIGLAVAAAAIALVVWKPWSPGSQIAQVSPVGSSSESPIESSQNFVENKQPLPKVVAPIEPATPTPSNGGLSNSGQNQANNNVENKSESPQEPVKENPSDVVAPWETGVRQVQPLAIPPDHPCADCLMALRNRDIPKARRQLALLAARANQSPESRDAVSVLELLVDHVDSFWKTVNRGLAKASVGTDVVLNGTAVVVAARDASEITLELVGKQKDYSVEQFKLDHEFAVAMAELGAARKGPALDAMIAAFLSVDDKGGVKEALEIDERIADMPRKILLSKWNDARASLESVAVSETEILPAPDKEKLAEATLAIIQKYRSRLRVRSLQEKEELAREFINQSSIAEEPVLRYAYLNQARKIAVKTGSVELGMQALQTQGNQFHVPSELAVATIRSLNLHSRCKEASAAFDLFVSGERMLDQLIDRERYEDALELVEPLTRVLRRLKILPRIEEYQSLSEELNDWLAKKPSMVGLKKRLRDTPGDASVQSQLGGFYLLQGNVKAASSYLSNSANERLKILAKAEQQVSPSASALIESADGWWLVAQSLRSAHASHRVRAFAMQKYGLAAPQADRKQMQHIATRQNRFGKLYPFPASAWLKKITSQQWSVDWERPQPDWERVAFTPDFHAERAAAGGVYRDRFRIVGQKKLGFTNSEGFAFVIELRDDELHCLRMDRSGVVLQRGIGKQVGP